MLRLIFLAVGLAAAARGQFIQIEVFMRDMNCPSCTESLTTTFKKLHGVERVETSTEKGSVRLDLSRPNRVSLEQVWDAIKRVGFTPGETKVNLRGTVKIDGSKTSIELPESGKIYEIEGRTAAGESDLKGTTQPPPDPRTPIRIRLTD
jgi:copper chaperone CopZ